MHGGLAFIEAVKTLPTAVILLPVQFLPSVTTTVYIPGVRLENIPVLFEEPELIEYEYGGAS